MVLLPELLTGKPQQCQPDLIPVLLMVFLRQSHRLLIEQARVSHLYRRFQPILMSALLLDLKDIQALRQKIAPADILRLPMPRHLLRILRHHLGAMDNI